MVRVILLAAVLLSLAVSIHARCDADSACPDGWTEKCARELSDFTQEDPDAYCNMELEGFSGRTLCVVRRGIRTNGCCENGR